MEWLSQLFSSIITGIGGWFSKWSTQKTQAKHEERMRQYDVLEKTLEGPETLSKKEYQKWFYEQEVTKKKLKRQQKKLEKIKTVPENYKETLKSEGFFNYLESLEQQSQKDETTVKEVSTNGTN